MPDLRFAKRIRFMSYTIKQIAELTDARCILANEVAPIDWLLTDSRSLAFPEETLFFALNTKRNNGANYIADLYDRGVRNFVISPNETEVKADETIAANYPHANFLLVPDTLKALQKLAEQHRAQFDIPVIGITGSNGKTIVKEWLHQLLSPDRNVVRSPRSYNSQIGVPLSVWQMNADNNLAIFEAGISEMGEMRLLEKIINPTIGILTTLGGAHQENFSSMQEKCMEKLELFKNCDVIIYNADNELINNCVSKSLISAREIAWSCQNKERPLFINSIDKQQQHTAVTYTYLGMENSFCIPFTDDASIENALHCLGVCVYLMLAPEDISARMAHLEPVAMRLEVKEGKKNCVLINDSYNSDLASLDIALDFLYRRSQDKMLKRTLILSDLLETGQSIATLYRQVAKMVHNRGIEKIIGVGHNISTMAARFHIEKHFFANTESLLRSEVFKSLNNEIILIKGSRSFGFERLSEELELKVHETILEINLNALVNNLNYFRSQLDAGTKTICMIKASAYGSGAEQVAKTLQEHRADYLAVAVADEGSELRKAGITASILIMNPEVTAFKTMFEYKLEPEIYNFRILECLIREAEKEGITQFPIHIKIDTGMHRLGFAPDDIPLLIKRLKEQTAVIPRSIFSHLAAADNAELDDYTREQIVTFDAASTEFRQAFTHRILRHISNSAGILRFPEARFDMVRLGIGLYGINPICNSMLENVSTLQTTILQIRNLAAGQTVGYNRNGKLTRHSRIAVLPIGYADGLNRRLGNGHFYCLVNGQKAPYVGNICMDVCMIDVTDIACSEGDKVIIFGNNLPITAIAGELETISYEVLTTISSRVKRTYFQD